MPISGAVIDGNFDGIYRRPSKVTVMAPYRYRDPQCEATDCQAGAHVRQHGTWIIPAERMKMKTDDVVPLSRQAVALRRDVKATGGSSKYVLPGRNPDKPMSNNTMLFALYRIGYKGRMTGHGFRSVASTILNEGGKSHRT